MKSGSGNGKSVQLQKAGRHCSLVSANCHGSCENIPDDTLTIMEKVDEVDDDDDELTSFTEDDDEASSDEDDTASTSTDIPSKIESD